VNASHLLHRHLRTLSTPPDSLCYIIEMNDFANLSLSDRKIIVGVDFGTTYSGLAWAETRRASFNHHNLLVLLIFVLVIAGSYNCYRFMAFKNWRIGW